MSKQPNIVILNPDEMRWDTMGHMGNRAAYTPNLDRLAVHEAVSFDHAYCQNPVCVPSRCSFLTGLYPHVQGHRTMRYLMQPHEETLFSELKAAGYHVWMNGRNDFFAGQIQGLGAKHADEIFWYQKPAEPVAQVTPAEDSPAAQWRQNFTGSTGHDAELTEDGQPVTIINDDPNHVYSHFKGVIPDGNGGPDWADTRAAIDRIRRVDELNGKPLCLFLGWTNPHPPYQVEQSYYDQIKADQILPPVRPEECTAKSEMIDRLREYSHMENNLSDADWMEMRHIYLAQCAKIDHMVGAVCDALKEAGIYDDTAIFFFSDHGDWCADYHLAEKAQNCFEDVLTRVPFLVKPPVSAGVKLDAGLASAPVELVDFYATAMEFAGVRSCHDHFGLSLRPMLEDRSQTIRQYAFSEGGRMPYEYQCNEWHCEGPDGGGNKGDYYAKKRSQLDNSAHEKGTMITDGHYKYIYRSSGKCEFYDLQADPYERTNLYPQIMGTSAAADPSPTAEQAQTIRVMEAELLKWYQTTCDLVPKEYDNRMTEDKLWSFLRRFVPAEYEDYCRSFIRETDPGIKEVMALGKLLVQK